MGYVVIICVVIGCLIYYLIKNSKSEQNENQINNDINSNCNHFKKTDDDIRIDTKNKYRRISEEQKNKYLVKRKKNLKIFYFSVSFVLIVVGTILLTIFSLNKSNVALVVVSIILFLLSGMLLIVYSVLINKTDEELIKEQIALELKRVYRKLTPEALDEITIQVKKVSRVWKEIKKLNKEFVFDKDICKIRIEKIQLETKYKFDNFDYDKWIRTFLNNNYKYQNNFQIVYENNLKTYNEYCKEYCKINSFFTEEDADRLNVNYEVYSYIERDLYKQYKHANIEKPTIRVQISYTSPTGRNSYKDQETFDYIDLIAIKEAMKKENQIMIENENKKRELTEIKRQKEKKLRELEKFEVKLSQKEKEINEREQEFIEATKTHIYTTDKIEIQKEEIVIDENLSLSQKLKLLRTQFDNGEITYEEYQSKRKELM